MAFTLVEDEVFASYEFTDEDEQMTRRRFHIRWDTDLITTLGHAGDFGDVLEPLSESALKEFTLSLRFTNDGSPTPLAGAENQESGRIVFDLLPNPPSGITKRSTVDVPSPVDAIRVAATGVQSNIIDVSDALIAALTVALQAGGDAYLSHGQDVDVVLDGYVHHKRSRRG
jgi:hypothetical protein